MAMQEQIIVQPYVRGPKGALKPEPQIPAKTGEAGRQRAERMLASGGRIVGVDVVRVSVDADAGDYTEPEYLARFGQVPEATS